MKKYDRLPLESQRPQFDKWFKILATKQVGNVFFLPRTGLIYRMNQFVDYVKENKKKEIELLDIEAIGGEVWEFEENLPDGNSMLVLVLRRAALSPDGMRLLRVIEQWLMRHDRGVLCVHELVPSELVDRNDWPSFVMRGQYIYSLPDDSIVEEYINNESQSAGLESVPGWNAEVRDRCGAQLWLVNELVRAKVEDSRALLDDLVRRESFVMKLAVIWSGWPKSYHEALSGRGESLINEEMKKIGVVDDELNIRGRELAKYALSQKLSEVRISDELVELRGKDITDRFALGERIFLSKLWNDKQVIEREEVVRLLWDDSSEISDWAIDQKMRRLREKISKLGLPIKIVTKKGEGYDLAR